MLFNLTLTAPQADALEDAALTFCPTAKPRIAPTLVGFSAMIAPEQLPQLVDATNRYRRLIDDSRPTRGLVAKLEKIQNGPQVPTFGGETPRA